MDFVFFLFVTFYIFIVTSKGGCMDQSMNVSLIRRYYLLAPTVLMYNLWPDYIHTDYTYVLESKGWKFKQCAIICNFRIRDPMAG